MGQRDDDRYREEERRERGQKERSGYDRPGDDPQERLDAMVRRLRENPAEFRDIRERFYTAETDEERINLLIDFAITDERLATLVPSGVRRGDQLAATVTTVTVTTVTIPDTAY